MTRETEIEQSVDPSEPPRLLDRTIGNLRRAWKDLTGTARVKLTGTVRAELPEEDSKHLKRQIDECLQRKGGEVSARAVAAHLGRTYLELNAEGRRRFLKLLAQEYSVDEATLSGAAKAWLELQSGKGTPNAELATQQQKAQADLRAALAPPRVRLLARFNALPEGVKFLVDMRAELIGLARHDPILKGLDDDLKNLLVSWFDVGFLDLRCINWDAPASLLEKIARYEAVHAVKSWTDIKNRLAPDRRCYAFFHPQMPDEPLIYVWVALVRGMADNVQVLLEVKRNVLEDPSEADAAIFYSISNAQRGLNGISFGDFLIKRVVEDLAGDFKQIKTFATLSPIPGFRTWLELEVANHPEQLLLPSERHALEKALAEDIGPDAKSDALGLLCDHSLWRHEPALEEAVRPVLLRLCARYLVRAKRKNSTRDRVAHFHLSNGARIERINWLGDTSAKGLRESCGMMVNYLYRTADIEKNHEAYRGEGRIRTSSAIKSLLRAG
jgi:malonyl-CoA decarboxylase